MKNKLTIAIGLLAALAASAAFAMKKQVQYQLGHPLPVSARRQPASARLISPFAAV
jgi:hypothetical protein